MLTVKDLKIGINDTTLVSNLNFQLKSQEILYIQGCNGIGKTSLLRTIAGLNTVFSGHIKWHMKDISADTEYCNSMEFIGHKPALKLELNAIDNIIWRNKLYLKPKLSEQAIISALSCLGIAKLAYTPCGLLSAGQLRKVSLSSLLVNNNDLWILDEPFTALDKKGIDTINSLLQKHLHQGGMAIVSSHQAFKDMSARVQTINLENYR